MLVTYRRVAIFLFMPEKWCRRLAKGSKSMKDAFATLRKSSKWMKNAFANLRKCFTRLQTSSAELRQYFALET